MKDVPRAPDTFRIRFGTYDSGERTFRGDVDIECECEVRGGGGTDQARFTVDVQTTPLGARCRFRDRGSARSFKLRSTSITSVDIDTDAAQATILGKAAIDGAAGSSDFRVDVKDLPSAPDTFRIRAGDYDSGERMIRKGDVDIECGDDDREGNGGKDKPGKGPKH